MRHPRHAPVNLAPAALALGPLAVAPAGAPADAQTPTGASEADSYCFSATVRVAGHVCAASIVNLDADGYQISESWLPRASRSRPDSACAGGRTPEKKPGEGRRHGVGNAAAAV